MSTSTEHTQDQAHGNDHEGTYLRTLVALLCLTIVTVAASYVDFGSGNIVIALTIASIKASLVALFFMHLRYEKPVNGIIAMAGFLFLGIFLMFCFIDFDTRDALRPVNWNGKMPMDIAAPVQSAAPAPAAAAPAPAPAPAQK
ncbi:MAG TPA: cytochrome C oxidase subunit IV family protein [Bryobacteraceae bacterium]|nr:cytochrome C oxidase subunit IV family protein [Bryobacteraceae bacterium]